MPQNKLAPVHPGRILAEDLNDMGISVNRLARDTRMPLSRASDLVNGKRAITAETALRLARFFGTSPEYWLNLQTKYDLDVAKHQVAAAIEREVLPFKETA
jgi:addiction module HigA family antidote